jgi:hypothetical protein
VKKFSVLLAAPVVCALAILLTFGLVFTSCGSGDDDGGATGGLSFSGEQVYLPDGSLFTGDMTITSNLGVDGQITGGKLSFSIGDPSPALLDKGFFGDAESMFDNFTVSPNDTQGILLDFGEDYLVKQNEVTSETSTDRETITYVYVDRNCTMTGTGKTGTMEGFSFTTTNMNISLKEGWNAICSNEKISMENMTATFSFKGGDSSSCKWTLR